VLLRLLRVLRLKRERLFGGEPRKGPPPSF